MQSKTYYIARIDDGVMRLFRNIFLAYDMIMVYSQTLLSVNFRLENHNHITLQDRESQSWVLRELVIYKIYATNDHEQASRNLIDYSRMSLGLSCCLTLIYSLHMCMYLMNSLPLGQQCQIKAHEWIRACLSKVRNLVSDVEIEVPQH